MSSLVSWCASKNDDTIGQVCINDYLHDYCLLDLFDHLPLAELVRIDQVCARWKALRWSSLCRRKKLTLLIKVHSYDIIQERNLFAVLHSNELRNVIPEWKSLLPIVNEYASPKTDVTITSIQWSQLELPEITFKTTKWLFDNFRNINSLVISVSELLPFHTEALKWLLDKWSSNLVSLKLYLANTSLTNMFRIYGSINSMKVLRQFTLVVAGDLQLKALASLPILSQLEEFYISSTDPTSLILDLLQNNATLNNCQLKRIGLANGANRPYNEPVGTLLSLDDHIATQIVLFDWHFTMSPAQLHLFCNKFSSLESIKLTIEAGQTYARMLNCLTQLKQLVYLELNLNNDYKISQFLHNDDDDQYDKLAQLQSVKSFNLNASIDSHDEIAQLQPQWTIPNVQVIRLNQYRGGWNGCSISQHEDVRSISHEHCALLFAKCFHRCLLNHTIYINSFKFDATWRYRRYC